MKGSILFNKDINIEVDVDPSAEEGARLVSAKNLVDGQEAGGGGGDFSTAEVTITNSTGNTINIFFPYIDADGVMKSFFILNDGEVKIIKTPIAENGAYYSTAIAEANVTGDVQFIQEETAVVITGDGTLEVLLLD